MNNVGLEFLIYLIGAVLFLAVIIHRAGKNNGTFLDDVTETDGKPPQLPEPPNRGVVCILTKGVNDNSEFGVTANLSAPNTTAQR